jgi:hypothetical protein
VRANTVLLNWFDHAPGPSDAPGLERYGHHVRQALRFGCNVVILGVSTEDYAAVEATPREARRIDVWYGEKNDGQLMLLFAYLMTRTPEWEAVPIRVLAPPGTEESGPDEGLEGLRTMLEEVRIPAEPHVVEWDVESVVRESGSASAVFLPFRLDGDAPVSVFEGPLNDLIDTTPITVLVHAAQEIDLDAEPEAGAPGQIAAAEDKAIDAAEAACRAEKDAERAADAAHKAAESAEEAMAGGNGEQEEIARMKKAAEAAAAEAEKMRRRAIKTRAKAEDAARTAQDLGAPPADEESDAENGRDGDAE